MTANITIKSKKIPIWAIAAGAALILILTTTLVLTGGKKPGTAETSNNGDAANTTKVVASTNKQELEIVDSGYTVYKDNAYFNYGVVIRNPNETYAVDFPTITITAYDSDGGVITTEDQVISKLILVTQRLLAVLVGR